ncbi:MAG: PDZ domain-containing protein [Candidatus Eremiobacteraeota bacterium]|nr:PDZ domain-containing protein [Candidatus Eremiobacteraeota bacterium]
MNDAGYIRYPTVGRDTVVFVCEDDLWAVERGGGSASRLAAGVGECSLPRLSPDGAWIAYVGRDEGHPEVSLMPTAGGEARRLTYMGGQTCTLCGWLPDGSAIAFTSEARSPFLRHTEAFAIEPAGGPVRSLHLGQAVSVFLAPGGAIALGRNNNDPARWKRYRGGTAGEVWLDASGAGHFVKLPLPGNPAWPMWLAGRVYFVCDHEGVGNIYSCDARGADLRKHTEQDEYYARFPSTDGRYIAYTAGGRLHLLDTASDRDARLSVKTPSGSVQVARRFVDAADNLEHFAPHPEGHSLALIARGQPFTLPNWEEAMTHHGVGSAVRYRLAEWLNDGKRFVAVDDGAGRERIAVHRVDGREPAEVVTESDVGRIVELSASPSADIIAFTNHRHELLMLDVAEKTVRRTDHSPAGRIGDLAWSPDGRWLAYSWPAMPDTAIIRIAEAHTGAIHDVTSALRIDSSPQFDPGGEYLFFLSTRDFNPVYDALKFDLSFPNAMRPFLVTLRKDIASPFVPKPRPLRDIKKKDAPPQSAHGVDRIEIDFERITDRVIGFPVEEGRYEQILGADGRALFTKFPLRGSLQIPAMPADEPTDSGALLAYDFDEGRLGTLAGEVAEVRMAADHRTIVYRSGKKMRAIDALEDLPEDGAAREAPADSGRRSGWIDLSRVSVEVMPRDEWGQMYREAWRLQRDHFWDEQMSRVDWQLVFERYARLLPLVRTRAELSDVIWEMQGELGTSHAYEMGGDYRKPPQYQLGFLGADYSYDERAGGYRITRILRGDSWDRDADSPLNEPGLAIAEGDLIVGVGGRAVGPGTTPEQLLVNAAGREVMLLVKAGAGDPDAAQARRVVVKSLRDERSLRYRAWVNANRALVHARTSGKVGYVHIPDMGPWGYAEFHRGYLSEFDRQGLIVDVRFNRGGHVSALLLEKLTRKRVGYDVSRWGLPVPYPLESIRGPLVGLTNQFAGSDGDIFSHCFKLYRLGPLVGKRTWGGVIGIWPRHSLVDGTVTTQPEFSFWFTDVGWRVENYGTDPDVEVDVTPEDYRAELDPQLEKAVELASQALAKHSLQLPDFNSRPDLSLPRQR